MTKIKDIFHFLNASRMMKRDKIFTFQLYKDYTEVIYKEKKMKFWLGHDYFNEFFTICNFFRYEMWGYLENIEDLSKLKNVFDIGAYHGWFAIFISFCCDKVFAFEPNSQQNKILKKNIDLNKITNIQFISKGISNFNGKAGFVELQTKKQGGYISKKGNVQIEVITLKDFIKDYKIDLTKDDLVKADIEGTEIELFKDSIDLFNKHKPKLSIVCYHVVDSRLTINKLLELIKQTDYKFIIQSPEHLTLYCY